MVVLGAVALAVVAAVWLRSGRDPDPAPGPPDAAVAAAAEQIPTFIELGSDRCTSCRAMIPVLEALRGSGCRLDVRFVDVWANPAEGERYGVRTIPTQVLLGPDGRELTRHTGFWSADAIAAAFATHGVPLAGATGPCTL